MSALPSRAQRWLLLVVAAAAAGAAWYWLKQPAKNHLAADPLQVLEQFEQTEAAKYWQAEFDAQERGHRIEELWNRINRSSDKLQEIVAWLGDARIQAPNFRPPDRLPHGIEVFRPADTSSEVRVASLVNGPWKLHQCEFRFIGVNPDRFYLSGHFTNAQSDARAILEGEMVIQWSDPLQVDARAVEVRTRSGPLPFREMFHAEVAPPDGSYFIDPLIVHDLERDGQLEVILAAANLVIRRGPEGRWGVESLCANDPDLMFSGILGDFNGDGVTDFLSAKFEGVFLFEGNPQGRFATAGRPAWSARPRLQYAQCLSSGDVDADGDLDLFIGQYKVPYADGQMPFPYFDANDGFPFFLLLNDGTGQFRDGTASAGLGAKRARRMYSSSLADLDGDADLDLILVSDFAGLDAFENDGSGKFTDATQKWFDEVHAFGMGQCLADFNRDGWLDLLMIGMNSPTADRLRSLGLTRPYDLPDQGKREAITFGNRLYFGQPNGTFRQSAAGHALARTGWSWGGATGDLDLDGWPDLYITNGHETREWVQEYEPEFWLHDIYIGSSQENRLAEEYFRKKYAATRARGYSYGGHERNRLYLNRDGSNFIEVAHLFGLAMPEDSRNVAMQDLDGDGRLDLVVTTFEAHPRTRQSIRFFRNELQPSGGAVQIKLVDPKKVGATARVRIGKNQQAIAMVAGESYRTQLPSEVQIGIGKHTFDEVHLEKGTNFVLEPVAVQGR